MLHPARAVLLLGGVPIIGNGVDDGRGQALPHLHLGGGRGGAAGDRPHLGGHGGNQVLRHSSSPVELRSGVQDLAQDFGGHSGRRGAKLGVEPVCPSAYTARIPKPVVRRLGSGCRTRHDSVFMRSDGGRRGRGGRARASMSPLVARWFGGGSARVRRRCGRSGSGGAAGPPRKGRPGPGADAGVDDIGDRYHAGEVARWEHLYSAPARGARMRPSSPWPGRPRARVRISRRPRPEPDRHPHRRARARLVASVAMEPPAVTAESPVM